MLVLGEYLCLRIFLDLEAATKEKKDQHRARKGRQGAAVANSGAEVPFGSEGCHRWENP